MAPHPRFSLVLLLLLLLAIPAAAQSPGTAFFTFINAKLGRISSVPFYPAGSTVYFEISAGWSAGGVPEDVVVDIDVPGEVLNISVPDQATCTSGMPIRCSLTARATSYRGVIVVAAKHTRPGKFTVTSRISSPTPDPFPFNNEAKRELEIVAQPVFDLHSFGIHPTRLDPSGPGGSTAVLLNSGAPATNVRLTVTLPEGGTFTGVVILSGTPECSVAPDRIVCTAPQLGFYEDLRIEPKFLAPDRLEGGEVVVRVTATAHEPNHEAGEDVVDARALLFRHIRVVNTLDEGAGSLRQAIIDANTLCATATCKITFRIPPPVPNDGWFTIRPETLLPQVRGRVQFEGATQSGFTGDTNAAGPEIEINGHRLHEGHGLHLRQICDAGLSDLAINGFPGHAIELDRDDAGAAPCDYPIVSRNYLGTDPRGLTAVPNGRGVVLTSGFGVTIDDNLISGNHRAGIFINSGFRAVIRKNRVGIDANGEPLGNGASGMFLNMNGQFGSGADIEDNVIAYNGEWGVARTPASEISLTRNSIYGNTSQGIDIGLDNETPNRGDDGKSTPNKPVLFSASYDPATNSTIVRGRLDSRIDGSLPQFRIDIYASASLSRWGYAQGEEMVASHRLPHGTTDFEIVVPRDLRGKLITATNNRSHYYGFTHQYANPTDTSEFSGALPVQ